jgi:hypothetical protein
MLAAVTSPTPAALAEAAAEPATAAVAAVAAVAATPVPAADTISKVGWRRPQRLRHMHRSSG